MLFIYLHTKHKHAHTYCLNNFQSHIQTYKKLQLLLKHTKNKYLNTTARNYTDTHCVCYSCQYTTENTHAFHVKHIKQRKLIYLNLNLKQPKNT